MGFWLTLLFVLMGAGTWLVEYRAQRSAEPPALEVRPARWVAWLCGNPRGDGTIDLEHGVRQLAGLIFLVGGPLTALLGLEMRLQAGITFLAYAVIALPALALVEWRRCRAEA